jgi:hypothetical protein
MTTNTGSTQPFLAQTEHNAMLVRIDIAAAKTSNDVQAICDKLSLSVREMMDNVHVSIPRVPGRPM